MKKLVVILGVLILLIVGAGWTFDYISKEGQFTKWSHTTAGIEHFEGNKAFYLGYHFNWEGIGQPTLQKVEFIRNDGTIVAKDEDVFKIEAFISETEFGAVDEAYVKEEGLDESFQRVKGYQPMDDFFLVLRTEITDVTKVVSDIRTVRITYKKLGATHFQNIDFEDGLIMER